MSPICSPPQLINDEQQRPRATREHRHIGRADNLMLQQICPQQSPTPDEMKMAWRRKIEQVLPGFDRRGRASLFTRPSLPLSNTPTRALLARSPWKAPLAASSAPFSPPPRAGWRRFRAQTPFLLAEVAAFQLTLDATITPLRRWR